MKWGSGWKGKRTCCQGIEKIPCQKTTKVKHDVRVARTSWSNSKKTRWGSLKFKKSSVSTKKLELFLWSYPKNLHILIFQNSYSSFLGILTSKVSQLSMIQREKSIFFLWLHCSELRNFFKSDCFLAGLGLTLDFPRLIKSEMPGYVHFPERFPHNWHTSA